MHQYCSEDMHEHVCQSEIGGHGSRYHALIVSCACAPPCTPRVAPFGPCASTSPLLTLASTHLMRVRYPTAHAGSLSAPLAVHTSLDLSRRSQEEATLSRAMCTGSGPGCTVGCSGASWGTLGWHLSPKRCEPVRGGSVPTVHRVSGTILQQTTGAPWRGGS
jgi:hypothetical protein